MFWETKIDRQRVLEAVRVEPGLDVRDLARMLRTSTGRVWFLVNRLKEAGKVRVYRMGNAALVVAAEDAPRHPSLLLEFSRAILAYLYCQPHSPADDVAHYLGAPLQAVEEHLSYLESDGLVQRYPYNDGPPAYAVVHGRR